MTIAPTSGRPTAPSAAGATLDTSGRSGPPRTPGAPAPPPRRWRRNRVIGLIATVVAIALAAVVLPIALAQGESPTNAPTLVLGLANGDVVLAAGHGFTRGDVHLTASATMPNGTLAGGGMITADTDGHFLVGFRIPGGYTGTVTVTASQLASSATGTLTIIEGKTVTITPSPVKISPSATPTVALAPNPAPVTVNSGCTASGVAAPCIGGATTGASGWGVPALDDEFNGTSINSKLWASSCPEYGGNLNGGGTSSNNMQVSGGNLILTEASSGNGACVTTHPGDVGGLSGFTFQYGYAEARIHFAGNGSSSIYNWPAWWTSSEKWPSTGEIDIAEGIGGGLQSNYHGPNGNHTSGGIGGNWSNGFHTFGVDREPGWNTVYWDGKQVDRYQSADGGAAEWFLLNVGDGGLGGQHTYGDNSKVYVDYVRVWDKS
jgi:hypothetical protein